ncbi:MAG: sigma-70 family RNA polymerase sigma factor [Anaerolineales bacterium]|nr:sigma-70 family RNA polymerase sigma factor [Anaerolineales bacterium]MCK5635068.1 sigma-70 family RNA polymerase sigma factor [Anaerolineales bacterium]
MAEYQRSNEEDLWIERATQGDDDAFAQIVENYQVPVYNLCYRMLGNKEEAEDAAQETFLRAYRNLKKYDPNRKFATWLLSIGSHYCIDRLRRRRLQLVSLDDLLPRRERGASVPGAEANYLQQEHADEIRSMLDGLGGKDRAAVILRYWYDFSYEEIAKSLSLSLPAVKSRLHRTRREMADRWSEQSKVFVNGGAHDEASAV